LILDSPEAQPFDKEIRSQFVSKCLIQVVYIVLACAIMEEDEASAASSTRRSRLWIIAVLLVAGSCMLAIVHLSSGLHAQLLANRRMVRALKEQLIAEGEEREALLRDKDATMSKTATLRTKSKLVTEELLDQQRKARRLQQELLLAREDVQILSKNCTLATQRLKSRYEVALRALHDRVVTAEECRSLLERNMEERAKMELSLAVMQDRAFNASRQLKVQKQKFKAVLEIANDQRDEIAKLKRELEVATANRQSASSSSSTATDDGDQQKSSSSAIWKVHIDPKSQRPYYYNSITRVTQWEKPPEID